MDDDDFADDVGRAIREINPPGFDRERVWTGTLDDWRRMQRRRRRRRWTTSILAAAAVVVAMVSIRRPASNEGTRAQPVPPSPQASVADLSEQLATRATSLPPEAQASLGVALAAIDTSLAQLRAFEPRSVTQDSTRAWQIAQLDSAKLRLLRRTLDQVRRDPTGGRS